MSTVDVESHIDVEVATSNGSSETHLDNTSTINGAASAASDMDVEQEADEEDWDGNADQREEEVRVSSECVYKLSYSV